MTLSYKKHYTPYDEQHISPTEIEQLAGFAQNAAYQMLSPEDVESIKIRVLDSIAVGLAAVMRQQRQVGLILILERFSALAIDRMKN